MKDRDEVLTYWLKEIGPDGWYAGGEELDAEISRRFRATWERARTGEKDHWTSTAEGKLALLIVLDQFPRNMFRDEARAFSTDRKALAVAARGIHRRLDMQVPEPERQFFYLPLMHSECRTDQDRCVRLFLTRMPKTGSHNLLHARAHREVIRRFGRFPYRNKALGRETRPEEEAYLSRGGYGATVEELRTAA